MKIYVTHSLAETEKCAQEFLDGINMIKNQKNTTKALVVGLYGDLGSGKTAFTSIVARLLGIRGGVTSPTFVIEKIYAIPWTSAIKTDGTAIHSISSAFSHLIHIDAYRLENASELEHLGWSEICDNPQNLIFIEWPERVDSIMPPDHIRLEFLFINETTREIKIMLQ